MKSDRGEYAKHFVKSAEAVWGGDRVKALTQTLATTGEAVWDVDNFSLSPRDEPQTNPQLKKER